MLRLAEDMGRLKRDCCKSVLTDGDGVLVVRAEAVESWASMNFEQIIRWVGVNVAIFAICSDPRSALRELRGKLLYEEVSCKDALL